MSPPAPGGPGLLTASVQPNRPAAASPSTPSPYFCGARFLYCHSLPRQRGPDHIAVHPRGFGISITSRVSLVPGSTTGYQLRPGQAKGPATHSAVANFRAGLRQSPGPEREKRQLLSPPNPQTQAAARTKGRCPGGSKHQVFSLPPAQCTHQPGSNVPAPGAPLLKVRPPSAATETLPRPASSTRLQEGSLRQPQAASAAASTERNQVPGHPFTLPGTRGLRVSRGHRNSGPLAGR
ncbi:hypothetical protein NDU88_002008 [Pleurodeles waltl]|uniref:Uncharacterized protein n=1 Tax=Pleurodeles waltl TaxID=8319 RepID=A0AAV7KUD5_PLEWA|nr:hypothetical protein NDU88_002008 [Pleurodeles waltl]